MSILSDRNAFWTTSLTTERRDIVTFDVGERDLDKREASYTTQISLAKHMVSYGNVKPSEVLQHLSSVCTDDLTGCDYQNQDPLTIPSEMYVNSVSIPISGHLTLKPEGIFAQGNGSQFVDCIVKTAPYGTKVSLCRENPIAILCDSVDHGILPQSLQPWPHIHPCLVPIA